MNAIIDEKKVPENLLGNLNETYLNSSHELLNKNLNKDGYLFLKNVVASKEVELARNEVFKKLYEINEIKDPYNEGIFSGKSDRDVFYNDRGDFWKDVSELDSIRNITNGKILHSIFDKIFFINYITFYNKGISLNLVLFFNFTCVSDSKIE